MNQVICIAIENRRIISFNYDGGNRVVEPYCYGISSTGEELLRSFQIRGFSRSRNPSGWKLFKISKITKLTITDDKFEKNRPKYNPKDPAMKRIFCKV
ncbi:MAG: hypothetical protein ACTSPD_19595 [Promethearchaeota archaeon]